MADRDERRLAARDPFFGEMFDELPAAPRVYSRDFLDAFWGRGAGGKFPAIDISEDERSYVVTAELPGAKREDVTVELVGGALTVHGEKKSEREEKGERRRYTERTFGAFTRSFTLPDDADAERVEAAFKDGVLTVTIAKRAQRKVRTVEVQGS